MDEIKWNNHPDTPTEAMSFMTFKKWAEHANEGEAVTYIKNASAKDIGMITFYQVKREAYRAMEAGRVALFQRRVHPDYPGFDYIAVKLSARASRYIERINAEPIYRIKERLRAAKSHQTVSGKVLLSEQFLRHTG